MKINFTPQFQYDTASTIAGAAGGASPLGIAASATGIGLGALQGLIGLLGAGKANRQLKKLFAQRKAFQTPKEIIDILGLTQFNAQSGFGSQTMDYLTNQSNRGLSAGLGAATRLGANPNDVSGIIGRNFQDIFKIGSENELLKMKKFDSLLNAKQLLAANKEAEYQSKENLIKDQMQAQSTKVAAGQQNLQSGVNLALSSFSSLATQNLWKSQLEQIKDILAGKQPKTSTGSIQTPIGNSGGSVYGNWND